MPALAPLLALLVSVPSASPARADDAYFMTLFAYQNPLNRPSESHTWATFARADADGNLTEAFTISWLPARLKTPGTDIHLLQRPEPGANFTLQESLALGRLRNRRMTRWGPFQVRPELYQAAVRRWQFLNGGQACYTVLDGGTRGPAFCGAPGGAVNCMHAVSDVFGDAPLRTGLRRGESGTEAVLANFLAGNPSLNFVRYPLLHEWLAARLGFADVPLADSLQELAPRGLTLASLERGSDVFRPGVGVRLLPPEAVTPWRVP